MIYYFRVPKGEIGEDYEFDGEYANSCSICKYNGNCKIQTNELGVYYPKEIKELVNIISQIDKRIIHVTSKYFIDQLAKQREGQFTCPSFC